MLGIVEAGGSDGEVDTEVGTNGFGVGLLFRNGFVATMVVRTLTRGKEGEGGCGGGIIGRAASCDRWLVLVHS